jgi:ribose-phosphate pyrophosphokinase
MTKLLLLSPNSSDFKEKLPNVTVIEMKHFPDGEDYIRIPVDVKGKDVLFIHRCYPEQDKSLVQLFLTLDSLKRQGATKIRTAVPYFPYARQDKIFLQGEALSSETISKMTKDAGCDELITFDCHCIKKAGEFEYAGLKIKNISLSNEILSYFKTKAKNPTTISPDEGARYLVEKEKGAKIVQKIRGEYNNEGDQLYRGVESMKADFDVMGKDVIIIDDMISTGTTMINAVKTCKDGKANKIYCGAAHGLFLANALENLKKAGAEEVIVSDTIKSPVSKISIINKLKGFL